jgi:hypothetical protein
MVTNLVNLVGILVDLLDGQRKSNNCKINKSFNSAWIQKKIVWSTKVNVPKRVKNIFLIKSALKEPYNTQISKSFGMSNKLCS